ncbi:MAG TPA: sugar phosphate isomerase/epimerase [Isosphaeraceae bacterium]|jgi:sugar phosphate isomerase/epimerase|nr:sugar phosphate isomerase/epimerase [Isosphaeraceae bacterium]
MKPCINQVTTLRGLFEEDLEAYARAGWSALEIWLTKLETYLQTHSIAQARALLEASGIQAVGASSQGGLLLSQGLERAAHWGDFRRRLELLSALDVPTLVVAADFGGEATANDYPRAIESLAEVAQVARSFNVRLALEFQKGARFCTSLDTALALVSQAGTDGLGVCLDLFHYYTGPSKFEDLAYLTPENLAWVQICDLSGTPRELAGDADRILPGDGDFQLAPIVDHLARIGYDGYVSLEVLNPQLWPIPAEQVADLGYQAVRRALARAEGASVTAGGF